MNDTWINKKYNEVKNNGLFKALARTKMCGLSYVTFLSMLISVNEFAIVVLFREYILLFQDKTVERTWLINPLNVGIAFILLKLLGIFLLRHTNMYQVLHNIIYFINLQSKLI